MIEGCPVLPGTPLPHIGRRELLIGAALLAAAGTAYAAKPRRSEVLLGSAKLDELVPKRFLGWSFDSSSGLVLPPSDQMRDQLYAQILTRVYTNEDGSVVMLLIAYNGSQDGTLQVHRPEVCYPASGYKLTQIDDRMTPISKYIDIPSRYIVAETELREEQLIYWTRLGDQFPRKWSEQKLAVIEENLEGTIPDGVLVRISTLAQGDGRRMLDRFAAELYRSVGPRMQRVLVGRR